jgi:hypothetical protein
MFAFFILSGNGFTQIKRVWAVDDGEKIKKEDLNNPLSTDPANTVWKNNSINVFGARNEIIAFQIIIQSGKNGAKNVNVTISDLKNGSSVIPGSAIGNIDPYDYRGRYIELLMIEQLESPIEVLASDSIINLLKKVCIGP